MINLFCTDRIVHSTIVRGARVQSVSILHNQYFFLARSIYTMHGDIVHCVCAHFAHTRHKYGKDLGQALPISKIIYHLTGDDCHGDRRLLDAFLMARRGGQRENAARLQSVDHIFKADGVLHGSVIGILLEQ